MATRGHLGGLSAATPQALRVLDAAGCDVVLVETVGVGQSEVEVARRRTPPWCCSRRAWATGSRRPRPGSWRSATSSWSTRPTGTARTPPPAELRHMLALGAPGAVRATGGRRIVKTGAARGEGIDELAAALVKHRAWLTESGQLVERRKDRMAARRSRRSRSTRCARGSVRGAGGWRLRAGRQDADSGAAGSWASWPTTSTEVCSTRSQRPTAC